MSEKPILFSTPMIRAILEGRKDVTRRVLKPQPTGELRPLSEWSRGIANACHDNSPDPERLLAHENRLKGRIFPFTTENGTLMSPKLPYRPGDILWVRETWCFFPNCAPDGMGENVYYRADQSAEREDEIAHIMAINKVKWRPSIFMPRWASRLSLLVKDVRIERLQEITPVDGEREGIQYDRGESFAQLWDSINGKKYPWASNPWVMRIEFERVKG